MDIMKNTFEMYNVDNDTQIKQFYAYYCATQQINWEIYKLRNEDIFVDVKYRKLLMML